MSIVGEPLTVESSPYVSWWARVAAVPTKTLMKWLVGSIVVVLGLAYAASAVFGVHDDGLFELEGDAMNSALPGEDAETIWNAAKNGGSTDAVAFDFVEDSVAGEGPFILNGDGDVEVGPIPTDSACPNFNAGCDIIFTGGLSADAYDLDEWQWKYSEPQDKVDITHGYAAAYEADNGDLQLYFGGSRLSNDGAAYIGLWLFKEPICFNDPDGDGTGDFSCDGNPAQHSEGDILAVANFTGGGDDAELFVYEWVNGGLSLVVAGADCDDTTQAPPGTPGVDEACVIANTVIDEPSTYVSPWPYDDKNSGGDGQEQLLFPDNAYFEGGINLSALFGDDLCFTDFLIETRSSGENFTNTNSDIVAGELNTCGSVEVLKYLDANANGAYDEGEDLLSGWDMTLSDANGEIATKTTDENGKVVFTNLLEGEYTVTETNKTGWVNTDPGDGTLAETFDLGIAETKQIDFGNVSPALSVTKECLSDNVFLNETIDYEIVVSNDGNVVLDVEIEDTLLGISTTQTIQPGADYEVPNSGYVATSTGTVPNTVEVSSDDFAGVTLEDEASCSTDVWQLSVDKDGQGDRDIDYEWTVTKEATPPVLNLFDGDSGTIDWTVTLDVTDPITDSQSLTGTITVTNPNPDADAEVVVSDVFPGATIAVDCGDGTGNGTVPAATDSADGELVCEYQATGFGPDGLLSGLNTASVTHVSNPDDATYQVDVTPDVTDFCVTLSDDFPVESGLNGVEVCADAVESGGNVYAYETTTEVCEEGTPFTVDNTATLADGDDADTPDDNSADASVDVNCYTPTVSKTAFGDYDERHTWSVEKTVVQGPDSGFSGDELDWDWTVTVSETESAEDINVTGTVTLQNPHPDQSLVVSLSDTLSTGDSVDIAAGDGCSVATVGETLQWTVPPASTQVCSYSSSTEWATLAEAPTSNTVTVVHNGITYEDVAGPIEYTVDEVIDGTATLSDDQAPGGTFPEVLYAGEGPWPYTYDDGDTCSTDFDVYEGGSYSGGENNLAVLDPSDTAPIQDDASVSYTCYLPSVMKDAAGTYDERHEWYVEKTVDPESQEGFAGETVYFDWTITVTEEVVEENFDVAGSIVVGNPNPDSALVVDLSDTLDDGTAASIAASLTCDLTGTELTVPAGGTSTCSYTANDLGYDDVLNAPTVNTATIGWGDGLSLEATDPIEWTPNVIDDEATLDDDQYPFSGESVTDGWTITYSDEYTCSSDRQDYTGGVDADNEVSNTAEVYSASGLEDESTATTEIDCYLLDLEKNVTPYFTRTYSYDIAKTAIYYDQSGARVPLPDGEVIDINQGDFYTLEWDITVSDASYGDSGFAIDTVVTVFNPSSREAEVDSVVDSIAGISLECEWSDPAKPGVIAGGDTISCTSTGDSVSGDTTSNSASVSAYGVAHDEDTATWAFDTPTTEVHKTVTVQDLLGGAMIDVTGDLIPSDPTYTWGGGDGSKTWTLITVVSTSATDAQGNPVDIQLECGLNQIPNVVKLFGDDVEDPEGPDLLGEASDTADIFVHCGSACTLTQGYWKTHSAAGPPGNQGAYIPFDAATFWKHRDETWDSIKRWNPVLAVYQDWDDNGAFEAEEEQFFNSGMTWWQVQWTAPQGDVYYNLAHQWIAAHLNIWQEANEGFGGDFAAAFATAPAEVQQAYSDALNWFDKTAPGDKLKGKDRQLPGGWHSILASFNEGAYEGWPHCDEIPEADQLRIWSLLEG